MKMIMTIIIVEINLI